MMKSLMSGAVAMTLIAGLVGCSESPMQPQADMIRHETKRVSNDSRNEANSAAEAIRNQTGKTITGESKSGVAEDTADYIEKIGERKADAVEKAGEKKADQLEEMKP
ncbi:hypothetical protein [Planctopirus limnophila]|nr:hypothetical protein [Planctopirus limnophila]